MTKNKHVGRLVQTVQRGLQGVVITIDEPKRSSAPWFIDMEANGRTLVVEYRPKLGFGLSSASGDSYGEGPDEFLQSVEDAAARVVALLRSGEQTVPQRVRLLQELREQRKVLQVTMATRLGVRQPTVSKIERRDDVAVSTLRRYVQALGGKLQITAEFSDGRFEIALDEDATAGTAR